MQRFKMRTAVAVVALVGLFGPLAVLTSPTEAAPRTTVSTGLAQSYVSVGGTMSLRGYINPKANNKTVSIERYILGKWRQTMTAKTNSTGLYRVNGRPTKPGKFSYRVRYGTAVSRTVTLVVTPVSYLSEMRPESSNSLSNGGSVEMNGNVFPRTLYSSSCCGSGGGNAEYNLGRKYKVLTATVGTLDSGTSTTWRGTWTIKGDGVVLASGQTRLGFTQPVSVNVSGVLRLRIEYVRVTGTSGRGIIGFGNAKVA